MIVITVIMIVVAAVVMASWNAPGFHKFVQAVGFAKIFQNPVVHVAYEHFQVVGAFVSKGPRKQAYEKLDATGVAPDLPGLLVSFWSIVKGAGELFHFLHAHVLDGLDFAVDVHPSLNEREFLGFAIEKTNNDRHVVSLLI